MPSNLFISNVAASTMMNSLAAQFNSANMQIYASTQPADGNTNTSGSNYILATVPFSTVAFASATSNVITAATTAVLSTTAAVSSGIAVFYRVNNSSGVAIHDGAVSTAGADLNLNTNNIAQGASFTITAYSITLPEH